METTTPKPTTSIISPSGNEKPQPALLEHASMMPVRKQQQSRLDPYTAELLKLYDQNEPLIKMQAWLLKQGVKTSGPNLSRFLKIRDLRRRYFEADDGPDESRKMDADAKPAPRMRMIIKHFRKLVMQLSANNRIEPAALKLSDQLARTAIRFLAEETRAAFRERELAIAEEKFAEAKKSDQVKALEICLEEAKQFPEVKAMYLAAFAALNKAKAGATA